MREADRDISRTGSSLGLKRDLKVYGPDVSLSPSFYLFPLSFFFFLVSWVESREACRIRRLGDRTQLGI